MRFSTLSVLTLWLVIGTWAEQEVNPPTINPNPHSIRARSALLMEASSGQILYSRNPDLICPPASLTKIMTAILLIEHTQPDDLVKASAYAAKTPTSSMHLRPGETVRVRDLLYALMLRSANDGAVAAAEHVAGSESKFVTMMNQKAKELGANRTTFVNPHGLHHPKHRSTARDIALITRYALQNPLFNEVVREYSYLIERSMNQQDRLMIRPGKFLQLYPDGDGVKTGYTRQAGACFVGSATRNGRRLIAVVLNSEKRDQDTITLMEHGFNDWIPLRLGGAGDTVGSVPVEDGAMATVPVTVQGDAVWCVPVTRQNEYHWELHPVRLQAPVTAGKQAGYAVLMHGDEEITRVPLIAARSLIAAGNSSRWVWYALGGAVAYSWVRRRSRKSRLLRSKYHDPLSGFRSTERKY